ncbi:hypothetical protein GCM10009019_12250 [Salarchaeum japonicum]|uniref:Transposase n=1 Tax=Salarchaeum japonicum TaxID=555573 RepID=A0AAV3T0I1_9EURY
MFKEERAGRDLNMHLATEWLAEPGRSPVHSREARGRRLSGTKWSEGGVLLVQILPSEPKARAAQKVERAGRDLNTHSQRVALFAASKSLAALLRTVSRRKSGPGAI